MASSFIPYNEVCDIDLLSTVLHHIGTTKGSSVNTKPSCTRRSDGGEQRTRKFGIRDCEEISTDGRGFRAFEQAIRNAQSHYFGLYTCVYTRVRSFLIFVLAITDLNCSSSQRLAYSHYSSSYQIISIEMRSDIFPRNFQVTAEGWNYPRTHIVSSEGLDLLSTVSTHRSHRHAGCKATSHVEVQ
jgi:hypothetical protein